MRVTGGERARADDPEGPSARAVGLALAALTVLVVACWWPVVRVFLAADDFLLLHHADALGLGAVTRYFRADVYHFRPLTRGAYFLVMERLVGADPRPYHVASIAVHALNTLLVQQALRRLGARASGALCGAALFGLSSASFTTVAWVSGIQPLAATSFVLLATILGTDALVRGGRWARWGALAAYVVALGCMEQAVGLPLLLAAVALVHPGARDPRRALRVLAPLSAAMLLFLAYMLIVKRGPETSPYTPHLGRNVAVNLARYLGWSLRFAGAPRDQGQTSEVELGAAHAVLALLVLGLALRRRWRVLVLAAAAFLAGHAATLPLAGHAFLHHTYLPAPGTLLVLAVAVDEALRWARLGARAQLVLVALLVAGLAGSTWTAVRAATADPPGEDPSADPCFVTRNARIARRVVGGLTAGRGPGPAPRTLDMVYHVPVRTAAERVRAAAVKFAVNGAEGVRLVYGSRSLDVAFTALGYGGTRPGDVFLFDATGRCWRAGAADTAAR